MGSVCKANAKTHNDKSASSISQSRNSGCCKSANSPVEKIMFLQRSAGNQAVQRLIKSGVLQAKLRIGQPNDIYEQEADRVAEQVMRMPDRVIQRKCAKCDKDEKKILQAKKSPGQVQVTQGQNVPLLVHEVLQSPGEPLDSANKAFMEPRFGHDFSKVRVHSNAFAEQSALDLNANAYTVGHNIVFGAGRFAPRTHEGQRLLAHELTHVVQQKKEDFKDYAEFQLNEIGDHYKRCANCIDNIEGPGPNKAFEIGNGSKAFPAGVIQRQLITPLAPGGGFSGLMARDRERERLMGSQRQLPFVDIKRNNIKFDREVGTDYGHWWTEIGDESYGWWPDHCPVTIWETIFGTGGDLNGVKGCGGKPKQDPHHGENADEMFKPILTSPKTDEQVKSEIRSFATSYSGEWRWTFGFGQNCRSFQRSLMKTVGLEEPKGNK